MCFCAVPAMVLEDSDVELQQAAGSGRRRPVLDSDSEKSPVPTEATGNVMLQRKRARADPAALQACPPPHCRSPGLPSIVFLAVSIGNPKCYQTESVAATQSKRCLLRCPAVHFVLQHVAG